MIFSDISQDLSRRAFSRLCSEMRLFRILMLDIDLFKLFKRLFAFRSRVQDSKLQYNFRTKNNDPS